MKICELLLNLEKLHTTELGAERIKRNLSLNSEDIITWCKEKIQKNDATLEENGKNYYVSIDGYVITVNKHSYTIITAHKRKSKRNSKPAKKEIIFKFVEAINNQDLPTIIEMMSEDFVFIDTYGNKENKEQMKTGWQGYFNWFPDYLIEINEYLEDKERSVILGKASASYQGNPEKHWQFPAAWKAVVSGAQIKTWQVYCDSKKQLDSMT